MGPGSASRVLGICALALVLAAGHVAPGLSLDTSGKLSLVDQDSWVAWALHQQVMLQKDVPLDGLVLPATHNSYNAANDGYFNERHLIASGQVIHNQRLSLAQQLNLGIRRITLQVHWVFDSLRVCLGGGALAAACRRAAEATGVSDACHRALQVEDTGEHTGCRRTDPTLSATLGVVAAFLASEPGSDAVLLVAVEDRTDGGAAQLDAALTAAFGDLIYTPADKTVAAWPSVQDLLEVSKRVVIEWDFDAPSDVMHASFSLPIAPFNFAKNFKGLPLCGYTHEGQDTDIRELGFGVVHESRMYMDMCKLVAGHDDPSVSIMAPLVCGPNFKPEYEVRGADSVGELSQAAVLQLVRCGLTPALDLATGLRLRDLVWSWRVGTGVTRSDDGAVIAAATDGRWMQADKNTERPVACRSTDASAQASELWQLTTTKYTFKAGASACVEGFEFAPPVNQAENLLLLNELRRQAIGSAWIASSTHPGANGAGRSAVSGIALAVAFVVSCFVHN